MPFLSVQLLLKSNQASAYKMWRDALRWRLMKSSRSIWIWIPAASCDCITHFSNRWLSSRWTIEKKNTIFQQQIINHCILLLSEVRFVDVLLLFSGLPLPSGSCDEVTIKRWTSCRRCDCFIKLDKRYCSFPTVALSKRRQVGGCTQTL